MIFARDDDPDLVLEAHIPHKHGTSGAPHTHEVTGHEVSKKKSRKLRHTKKKRELGEPRAGKPEIHSAKWHRCIEHVQRRKGGGAYNAYAVCTSSIGKAGTFAKGHGGSASPKRKVHEAEGCGVCAACKANKRRMREATRLDREYRQVLREAARGRFEEVPAHPFANLQEYNQCHAPAGSSAGGQFCSKPMGDLSPGDKFRFDPDPAKSGTFTKTSTGFRDDGGNTWSSPSFRKATVYQKKGGTKANNTRTVMNADGTYSVVVKSTGQVLATFKDRLAARRQMSRTNNQLRALRRQG